MRFTVQQMQNLIELTKEDWKITLTDMQGYQIITLPIERIVIASHEELLLYTLDSTERFIFTHNNSYAEAELNRFKLYDPDYSRTLNFENYIPYTPDVLAFFKLLGQERISITYKAYQSAKADRSMIILLSDLLNNKYNDVTEIENPIYPYEERKRIFNKK